MTIKLFSPCIAKGAHILAAVFNLLYVYTPLHLWKYGFMAVQYVSMPLLVISGVLMVRYRKKKDK